MIRAMLAIWLTLVAMHSGAVGLTAKVDRHRLALDETLVLTLEASDPTHFGTPDLRPLEARFVVASPRRLESLPAGSAWQITLQPRYIGDQQIPSLQLGEWRSEPVNLTVLDRAEQASAQLAPIFIDASLEQDSVYVQAQAVLTLRIYHSVSLYDDSTLSPLQMPDAHVERIGDFRTYERTLGGVRHGVIEVRYAIFPQRSGELTIPSQVFSATTAATGSNGSIYDIRPGRSTQVKSPSIPLIVRPQPPEYPADAPWLPARRITLSEVWSAPEDDIRVGDSVTRSLMIAAEGLTAAQLPPLPASSPPDLRRYPDQPTLGHGVDDGGILGSREQREALVPGAAGEFEIAGTELFWWNTLEDRLEVANLPARTFKVESNPELVEPPVVVVSSATETAPAAPAWPWQLSTLVLAFTTLAGFGLWWRARQRPAVQRTQTAGPSTRSLLDDLRRACVADDTQGTRQALDAWARQQPETLSEMAARHAPLSEALDELNSALYSESGDRWQGQALWQAVSELPACHPAPPQADTGTLPPLYPR
ncbi:BatD family protein [Stutzerimonas tarimensis]|uniref:BatD family protein n=1 Tax=Stutzerimonas tarimensis TaxID=1507735 RepID=A0ABV7T310_9GAMM